jgi:dolichol-phosphate mannosyltransferase
MPPKHWIVLPTYNEADNILAMLSALRALSLSPGVLVVDDNSPDGTANLVRTYQEAHPEEPVAILVRPQKEGLGRAYEAGFRWVLAHTSARYIYEMDADFSHAPKDVERLAQALEEADLVVGSRYVKGITVVNWPLSRILLSYGASWYVRTVIGMPVKDPTAGFVGYRRELLEAILALGAFRFRGYAFQIELKYKAYLAGGRMVEVPIVFTERMAGRSKMSSAVIWEAIWGVLWLRWRRAALRRRLRALFSPRGETPR